MVQTTKNVENKLSSQEIEDLLAESDKFQKLSSFEYLGKEWDTQSFWAFIIGIGTWIVFWKLFNLGYIFKSWNAEWIGHLTFILYIIISFMNFFNSATNVSDVESERVNIAAQQSFIQGGIAVFILPFVFLYNIPMEDTDKTHIYVILITALMVSSLAIIIVNVQNVSTNIRLVRKIQQSLFNQGLILFMLALFMVYIVKTRILKGAV
jgi:hypothetical protein